MTFNEANLERLARGISQCFEAIQVPRRLGGDATDKELADDKRMARRMMHRLSVAQQEWKEGSWKGRHAVVAPDGSGARLRWSEWWEEWQENATELKEQAENRSQQHRIDRELEAMAHVFADLR